VRRWAHIKLKFGGQLTEPDVRRLFDLRDVAFDTAWFEGAVDRDAYYMYREKRALMRLFSLKRRGATR
jgi:hypothetical protein